jgi:protoheme IX farnesyltransferase
MPVASGMSHAIYLLSALILGGGFLYYAWMIWRRYSDAIAMATFRYSIAYLSLLFAALLVDHYWPIPVA